MTKENTKDKDLHMPVYMQRAFGIYVAKLESMKRAHPEAAQEISDFAAACREAAGGGRLKDGSEFTRKLEKSFDALVTVAQKDPALEKKLADAEFAYGSALVLGYTRKALKRASHSFNIAAQKNPEHKALLKEMGAAVRGLVPTLYQKETPELLVAQARFETAIDKLEGATAKDEKLGDLFDKLQDKFTDALLNIDLKHPGASMMQDEMKIRARAQSPKP